MKDIHKKNTKYLKRRFGVGRRRQAKLSAVYGQYLENKKLWSTEKLYPSARPGPGVTSRAGLADRFEELLINYRLESLRSKVPSPCKIFEYAQSMNNDNFFCLSCFLFIFSNFPLFE